MNIGVINESGKIENRAGLSPSGVSFLVEKGHEVYLQAGSGLRSGYSNEDFIDLGAQVVFTKEEVFGRCDIVLNISPLNEEEAELVKEDQILLGFHHLAVARKSLVESLLKKNVTMIGYEIIQDEDTSLPFLESLSEQADQGGRGLLIGSVVSVPPATAVIVGSTILARSAVCAMLGAGAHTIALGRNMDQLREIENLTGGRAVTLMASQYNLARMMRVADILIGAVLRPGERAPVLITREMVKSMKKGSILIDLAIDQGGCAETSRPTTLEQPTYVEEGVTHYCVTNITSTVSRTSTKVISNLVVPYLLQIGELGLQGALESNPSLGRGVYMHKKNIVKRRVAERFGFPHKGLVP
jgi:alanine dehydrogenase